MLTARYTVLSVIVVACIGIGTLWFSIKEPEQHPPTTMQRSSPDSSSALPNSNSRNTDDGDKDRNQNLGKLEGTPDVREDQAAQRQPVDQSEPKFGPSTSSHDGLFFLSPEASPSPDVDRAKRKLRSLRNGQRLCDDFLASGEGQLTIINGTSLDSVVTVVSPESDALVRCVYVKSHSNWTMGRLLAGSYRVIFAIGKDWDHAQRDFAEDASYEEFDKTLIIKQTATLRSHITITLHPVLDGNVRTISTSRARFRALMAQRQNPGEAVARQNK